MRYTAHELTATSVDLITGGVGARITYASSSLVPAPLQAEHPSRCRYGQGGQEQGEDNLL